MDWFIKMYYLSKEMLAPYAPVLKLSNTQSGLSAKLCLLEKHPTSGYFLCKHTVDLLDTYM